MSPLITTLATWFAETPIPGGDLVGNGWPSLLLQGGAFGLLVIVVCYLYPQMASAAITERQARDAAFTALVNGLQDRADRRDDKLVAALDKQSDRLEKAMLSVCRGQARGPGQP